MKKSLTGLAVGAATATAARPIVGANDRIRIGMIGCGGRGNSQMRRILAQSRNLNVEVAALCDVWKLNLEKTVQNLAESQDVKPYTTSRYEDLLEGDRVDAVFIATPDFAHTPILIAATKVGKDAFVEKPMATRLEDATEALALVRKQQTVVQIGTQRRSDDRYHAAARIMRSGILGTISEVDSGWHDSRPRWARAFDDVRKEDVDWEQFLMFLPDSPFSAERFRRWHLFEDFTVGTPGLLGSHLIDVVTWFMGDPLPTSAVAHGGVYVWKDGREHADTLDCILEYPKGFLLNYSSRLGNRFPLPADENAPIPTTFYGTRGTFDTWSWKFRGEGGTENSMAEAVEVPPADRPEHHVQNWLECIRSRGIPNAPIETGYAHSVASIMCYKAWKTGQRHIFNPITLEIEAG